jgi:hypothetical protein
MMRRHLAQKNQRRLWPQDNQINGCQMQQHHCRVLVVSRLPMVHMAV